MLRKSAALVAAVSAALVAPVLFPGCVTVRSDTAAGPREKAANGMEFTHERLGAGRHFLTVYDTRQGVGWLADSYHSMSVFAHSWAARSFPRGYDLDESGGVNMGTRAPFTIPEKSFIITEER
jgi:hypothetical protein